MKTIEIDLNKLSLEELKLYMSLAEKQEEKEEVQPTERQPKKTGFRKRGKKRNYEEILRDVKKEIQRYDNPVCLSRAIIAVYRKKYNITAGGSDMTIIKEMLNKNLWGIRKVMLGGKRVGYIHKSKSKEEPKDLEEQPTARKHEPYMRQPTFYTKFRSERQKYYGRLGVNFRDAFHLTTVDWNNYKASLRPDQRPGDVPVAPPKQTEPKVELKEKAAFPEIRHISNEIKPILRSLLKSVIHSGTRLSHKDMAYTLNIDGLSNWNEFVEDFIMKSIAISNFLGVENKFKIFVEGITKIIKYG